MATMIEHPKICVWINELESLGLSVKKINEFNDLNEIRDLAEIIKLDKYLRVQYLLLQQLKPQPVIISSYCEVPGLD